MRFCLSYVVHRTTGGRRNNNRVHPPSAVTWRALTRRSPLLTKLAPNKDNIFLIDFLISIYYQGNVTMETKVNDRLIVRKPCYVYVMRNYFNTENQYPKYMQILKHTVDQQFLVKKNTPSKQIQTNTNGLVWFSRYPKKSTLVGDRFYFAQTSSSPRARSTSMPHGLGPIFPPEKR